MSEMELIELAFKYRDVERKEESLMTKDEIRQTIAELERQKPKNVEEFEFREAEIGRLCDMLLKGSARKMDR